MFRSRGGGCAVGMDVELPAALLSMGVCCAAALLQSKDA